MSAPTAAIVITETLSGQDQTKGTLKSFVQREFRSIYPQEAVWQISTEEPSGSAVVYKLRIQAKDGQMQERILRQICSALADYYMEVVEPCYIGLILKRDYWIQPEALEQVNRYISFHLNDSADELRSESPRAQRRWKILVQLFHYLSQHSSLHIQGFFHFRLQEYRFFLEDAIFHAVEEFEMEQEYSRFIELLRNFVLRQELKTSLIHVLPTSDGSFQLMDLNGFHFNQTDIEAVLHTAEEETGVACEDLLISAIIALAPKRLILHSRKKDHSILRALEKIFGDRAIWCPGCKNCERERVKTTLK